MAAIDGASPIFSEVEEKQEMVEGALSRCTSDELKSIAAGLTNTEVAADATRIQSMRRIRDKFDGIAEPSEKGRLFLTLLPLVPSRFLSRFSDIIIKGQDPNDSAAATSPHDQSMDQSVVDLMRNSAFRKEFKIDGKIGRSKENLNMISLNGQIAEAKRKGYSSEEIAGAIKKAVTPGEMKTYLDSMTNLSLEDTLTFIESALKEKSSSELFYSLSNVTQNDGEDAQSFLMRAMELRQKCALISQKPDEVEYSEDLVRTMFLKRIRLGLASDAVKSRMETVIERNDRISDSALIQALNKIASEEAERDCKRKTGNIKSVKFGAVTTACDNSGETDLHTTVNKLAEQMTMLSVELAKLKSKPTSNTSGANRFRCKNCVSANRRGSCPHCWECGSSDHKLRDCPESN